MEKKAETWMELCELASKEPDSNTLIALTSEIMRLLDERTKGPYGQTGTQEPT
jgi:hypothetical protein